MSVSSEEINLLVQRYLQELGFEHTAFAFGCESQIPSKPIANREIPVGSLVYLVQKGIIYSQMEAAADEAASQNDTAFGHQLQILRSTIKQNTEIAEELSAATRRLRILPTQEQTEPSEFYLSQNSSLFLQGHSSTTYMTAWNHDSSLMASCSSDGTVCIWKFFAKENGNYYVDDLPKVISPISEDSAASDITFICWSSSENYLAAGTFTGIVVLYNENGEEVFRNAEQQSPITSIAFTQDGKMFAAGSADGTISIF